MDLLQNFSTREKNLWSELLVDIVVGLFYFPKMINMMFSGADLTGKGMAGLITETVILAIVTGVIISIFLHTQKKPEQVDERDHLFDARGSRIAFAVLALCIALIMGNIIVYEMLPEVAKDRAVLNLSSVVIAHLLLLSLFLSSVIKTIVQLYFYRRGY